MMQNLFLLFKLWLERPERKQKPVHKKTSLVDKIEITININKG